MCLNGSKACVALPCGPGVRSNENMEHRCKQDRVPESAIWISIAVRLTNSAVSWILTDPVGRMKNYLSEEQSETSHGSADSNWRMMAAKAYRLACLRVQVRNTQRKITGRSIELARLSRRLASVGDRRGSRLTFVFSEKTTLGSRLAWGGWWLLLFWLMELGEPGGCKELMISTGFRSGLISCCSGRIRLFYFKPSGRTVSSGLKSEV